jgi:hypothetical protein
MMENHFFMNNVCSSNNCWWIILGYALAGMLQKWFGFIDTIDF